VTAVCQYIGIERDALQWIRVDNATRPRWVVEGILEGEMQLSGKIALVTGAQQGIGRATALAFAEAGADVAVNWLDDEKAVEEVTAGVRAAGRRALPIRADVADLAAARAMVAQIGERLGPLDVLVNNAGVFPRVSFLDMTEADWDYVLDVNLKGACFCAQAAAKQMVGAGRAGAIINLTSGAAFRGSPRGVHYCASKGGVLSMTRQMALELAPHRIRVNAIAPGLTDTAQPRYGMSEEEVQAAGRALPLGHMAQPEDIARAAVFLASEDVAGFITGQCLHVNGGGYLA
jgi:NAD(P)-dependent dehydrogenase (short-subunit alcohol dehydrogenase family)